MPASDRTPPIASSRKPRKSRGRGLRTTTGCKVCRKRHMKCDEVKPICGPCVKSSRACAYDADASAAAVGLNDAANAHEDRVRRRQSSGPLDDAFPWSREEAAPDHDRDGEAEYDTETAPSGWFGLLSTSTADVNLDMPSQCSTNDHVDSSASRTRPNVMQVSTIAPSAAQDPAHQYKSWETQDVIQLQGLELDMLHHYVTQVSAWIDVFDPAQHFGTLVPRLALRNEGLMKAILAIGARHLAGNAAEGSCEVVIFKHAAVQYYSETLQYLQSAMQSSSYKNSPEVLATTLIISTYEMCDGAGKGWDRHLKGVFWLQRTREINGESGGLEQAVWWGWIHQDLWAAFRERRRCFSFFKPTRPYSQMGDWDVARRIVYILAQCVNFCSDEEKRNAERDLSGRAARADELSRMLDDWHMNKGISFDSLPLSEPTSRPFKPIWIHPPAFAIAMQMYHVARIILASHRPTDHDTRLSVKEDICTSVDVVAGITLRMPDGFARALSTQCLFTAGLFCTDEQRRKGVLEIVERNGKLNDLPPAQELANELRTTWTNSAVG